MPTAAAVHPHLTTAGIGAMKNPVTPHLNMATSSPVMMSRMLNISMRNRLCVLLRRTSMNVKKATSERACKTGRWVKEQRMSPVNLRRIIRSERGKRLERDDYQPENHKEVRRREPQQCLQREHRDVVLKELKVGNARNEHWSQR